METEKTRSTLMLIGSMLIFGSIGIFRRFIPFSSAMLACARGLIGAICLMLFVKLRGGKIRHGIGTGKVLLLLLSGGIMGANWILLFEAYNYTSVATATLCYYMEPTIVMLVSPLLFRERLTPAKLICTVLAIAGMVLVSGAAGENRIGTGDLRGILFGLSAAVLYAAVVVMNMKVRIGDAYEKSILQLLGAAVTLIPYLLLTEDLSGISFNAFSGIMLAIVGIVHTGIAYALYFGSIGGLKAQSVAVLSYIDPVFALILSAAVLHEKMTAAGIIGAVLIIGSALICETGVGEKKRT